MYYLLKSTIRMFCTVIAITGICGSASNADATFAPLANNGVVSATPYSAGVVQSATSDISNQTPYIPVVQDNIVYNDTPLTTFSPVKAKAQSQLTPAVAASINLNLSTLTPIAKANTNVIVTLRLVDTGDVAGGPGSSLFSFGTNIGIDSAYLSFVGGFTVDPTSPFTSNENPFGTTASNLSVAYSVNLSNYVNASNGTPITLGSFVVHVGSSGLPNAGTTITLGSQSALFAAGGSEVISSNGTPPPNVLTSVTPVVIAPEPSSLLSLVAGLAGTGLLIVRKRARAV